MSYIARVYTCCFIPNLQSQLMKVVTNLLYESTRNLHQTFIIISEVYESFF